MPQFQPSALEQYMLELINAERALAGAPPLAYDDDLSESAEDHSKWMIATDTFSHFGAGNSSAGDRMNAAGYDFTGSWTWGENIALRSTRDPAGLQDEADGLHDQLMNSPGHRANILGDQFREIGIGIEIGDYKGFESAFATQNFARTGTGSFLTGVAFDDRDGDRSYDPGEGLGGLSVALVDSSGTRFATTTLDAGGYQLELPAGTYTASFSGNGIKTTGQPVTIGSENVKLDLVDPAESPASPEPQPEPEPDPAPQPDPDVVAEAPDDTGASGRDTISWRDGFERLFGGSGEDRLDGGWWSNRISDEEAADRLDAFRAKFGALDTSDERFGAPPPEAGRTEADDAEPDSGEPDWGELDWGGGALMQAHAEAVELFKTRLAELDSGDLWS